MVVEVRVSGVQVHGPLAGHAAGFAEYLAEQGYTEGSVRLQVQLVRWVSRWLETEGVDGPSGLTELAAERFIAARRENGYRLFRSRLALVPVLEYLRGIGAAPAVVAVGPLGPTEELLDRFRRYLLVERALSVGSVRVYVTAVGPFVAGFEVADRIAVERITAADVSAFVLAEATRRDGTSIRSVATGLRSLLAFLHVAGLLDRSLTAAVPGVGAWRSAGLPLPLERGELTRLLGACDRRTPIGRRDYAIVVLMGRLGLRCSEVAGLRLENIDWRAGELVVYGKGRRDDRLPLPVDVGDAIAEYLHHGRPVSAIGRAVFVRSLAPHRAMSSEAVSAVVSATARRAGLGKIRAHRLRHTAATELLRAGGSLPEVSQVLRHRRLISTAIYAKVDDHALRELARVWPGSGS